MSQWRQGTVTLINGNATVVGSGTLFNSSGAVGGELFSVTGSGVGFEVANVSNAAILTLTGPYTGANLAGANYALTTSYTPFQKLPYPEFNDVDTPTIMRRLALKLDNLLGAAIGAIAFAGRVLFTDANGAISSDANIAFNAATGTFSTKNLTVNGNVVTWNAPTHSSNHTFSGNVTVAGTAQFSGNTVIGDAGGDILTVNANTVTWNAPTHSSNHVWSGTQRWNSMVAIGQAPSSGAVFIVGGSGIVSSATQRVFDTGYTFSNAALTSARGYQTGDTLANGAGATYALYTSFRAADVTKANASDTLTLQVGFDSGALTSGVTNYGFRSATAAAAGRFNFFASGSANNAYAGNSKFGSTDGANHAVDVAGNVALTGRLLGAQGANVASGNNITLGTDGNRFQITGTTQINGVSNAGWTGGSRVTLMFQGSLTVVHANVPTGASRALKLSGAVNFSATANDQLTLEYDSLDNNFFEVSRTVI